jgi:hypothetical protein
MMPASLVATEVDALPRGQAVAPNRPDGRSLVCGGVPGRGARAYRLRGVQAGAAPERTLPCGRHGFLREWTRPYRWEANAVVRIVGERWSPRSHEMRDLLERYAVPHAFYPVDSEGGRALLRSAGRTAERLPVWVLFDERALVAPSNEEAADALNTAESRPDGKKQTSTWWLVAGACGRRLRRLGGPLDLGIVRGGDRRPGRHELDDTKLPGLRAGDKRPGAGLPGLATSIPVRRASASCAARRGSHANKDGSSWRCQTAKRYGPSDTTRNAIRCNSQQGRERKPA